MNQHAATPLKRLRHRIGQLCGLIVLIEVRHRQLGGCLRLGLLNQLENLLIRAGAQILEDAVDQVQGQLNFFVFHVCSYVMPPTAAGCFPGIPAV